MLDDDEWQIHFWIMVLISMYAFTEWPGLDGCTRSPAKHGGETTCPRAPSFLALRRCWPRPFHHMGPSVPISSSYCQVVVRSVKEMRLVQCIVWLVVASAAASSPLSQPRSHLVAERVSQRTPKRDEAAIRRATKAASAGNPSQRRKLVRKVEEQKKAKAQQRAKQRRRATLAAHSARGMR